MRQSVVTVTVSGALIAVLAGYAQAAAPPAKADYSDSFTSSLPGRAAGRVFHDTLTNRSDPDAKPPATTHVHTQLPTGARYNTGAVPACTATDAAIMFFGPSACPAKSKVGTNDVTIDSGVPGSGRYAHEDVTFFNEPGGLIVVSHDSASGAYVVLHGRIKGGSFDLDQPPLPGTPPDGGATKSEHGTFFRAIGSGGRSYITTPRTCPASRIWRFHYRYTFSDGRKQTVTSDQRCQRRPRHRLRIRVRGVPSDCVKSSFTARVRVSGGAAVRRVRILVDGRSLAKRRARRFDQRIDASALPPGRHRLTARVRDHAGDTATATVPFRRC